MGMGGGALSSLALSLSLSPFSVLLSPLSSLQGIVFFSCFAAREEHDKGRKGWINGGGGCRGERKACVIEAVMVKVY